MEEDEEGIIIENNTNNKDELQNYSYFLYITLLFLFDPKLTKENVYLLKLLLIVLM